MWMEWCIIFWGYLGHRRTLCRFFFLFLSCRHSVVVYTDPRQDHPRANQTQLGKKKKTRKKERKEVGTKEKSEYEKDRSSRSEVAAEETTAVSGRVQPGRWKTTRELAIFFRIAVGKTKADIVACVVIWLVEIKECVWVCQAKSWRKRSRDDGAKIETMKRAWGRGQAV